MADETGVSSTDNPDPFAPADERVHEQGAIDGKTATPTATDEQVDPEERNPSPDHAPTAQAVMGDPGFRVNEPGAGFGPVSPDMPFASSAPPPGAQSGVPLAEDRAAGVEPGPSGPIPGPGMAQPDTADTPDHDGSEGQSTTPPLGG